VSSTKKKHILYLAHGNNDLDHYLPILHRLNGKSEYEQTLLYIYEKDKVLTNTLHRAIMAELTVNHISLNELSPFQKIVKLFSVIEKSLHKKIQQINNQSTNSSKKYSVLFLKGLVYLNNKVFNSIKFILFPHSIITDFMDNKSFSLIIIDTIHASKSNVSKDPLSYALYYLLQAAKIKNIPILMISHGATIRYDKQQQDKIINGQIFPDMLALCNEMEVKTHTSLQDENTSTVAFGDVRYDAQWIEKLESTARKNNIIDKPANRLVILYIVANLTFTKNKQVSNDINADIFRLLDDFEDTELWVKAHPRYPNIMNNTDDCRIKVFDNDVDTNVLLSRADLVLSPLSGILFQHIIKGKRVLYYDRWREYYDEDTWTVFDETPCVYRASNYDQLKAGVAELKKNSTLYRNDVEKFYGDIVSGGIPLNKSIISNYTNTIQKITA
jgi:hypothetical protein